MPAILNSPLAWLVIAYLIGSFPSAQIFSRLFGGGDIRQVGSGNAGGMNTLRNVGVVPGLLTGLFDVGKGALTVWLAGRYGAAGPAGSPWCELAAAVGVVAGHNWMLFLRFRGGKGLGSTAGVLLVLHPLLLPVFLVVIAAGAFLLHDTNVGACLAALGLPFGFWWAGGGDLAWIVAGVALAAVIAIKHTPDLKAYVSGRRRMI